MRIFPSAEYCFRVARWMSLLTFSASSLCVPDLRPLKGYDIPEILLYPLSRNCLIGAEAGQTPASRETWASVSVR